MRKQLISLRRK